MVEALLTQQWHTQPRPNCHGPLRAGDAGRFTGEQDHTRGLDQAVVDHDVEVIADPAEQRPRARDGHATGRFAIAAHRDAAVLNRQRRGDGVAVSAVGCDEGRRGGGAVDIGGHDGRAGRGLGLGHDQIVAGRGRHVGVGREQGVAAQSETVQRVAAAVDRRSGDRPEAREQTVSGPEIHAADRGNGEGAVEVDRRFDLERQLGLFSVDGIGHGGQFLARIEVEGFGNIDIRLLPDSSPLTVGAFLGLVDDGAYDNSTVYRVVEGGVIEAGRSKVEGGAVTEPGRTPSEAENGLMNLAGTIATVPNNDDDPDSFTSAFAINLRDNPEYDFDTDTFFGRTVFGQVEAGLEVATAISRVAATDGTPNESLVIVSVSEIAVP